MGFLTPEEEEYIRQANAEVGKINQSAASSLPNLSQPAGSQNIGIRKEEWNQPQPEVKWADDQEQISWADEQVPESGAFAQAEPDLKWADETPASDGSLSGELAAGWQRGVHQMKGLAFGALPGMAASGAQKIFGESETLQDIKTRGLEKFTAEEELAKAHPAAVESFTEIPGESAGDTLKRTGQYVAGTLGQLGPSMVEGAASAAAGFLAAGALSGGVGAPAGAVSGFFSKAAVRGLAKEFAKKSAEEGMAKGAAKLAGKKYAEDILKNAGESLFAKNLVKSGFRELGAKAGIIAGTTALEAPGNWAENAQRGYDNPVTALATGAVSGYIETLGGNFNIIKKILGPEKSMAMKTAMDAAASGDKGIVSSAMRSIAKFAKEALINGGEEFGQEALQEISSLTNIALNDPTFEAFTKENVMRVAESGIGGLVGGVGGQFVSRAVDIAKGNKEDADPSTKDMYRRIATPEQHMEYLREDVRNSFKSVAPFSPEENERVKGAAKSYVESQLKKGDLSAEEIGKVNLISAFIEEPHYLRALGFGFAQPQKTHDLTAEQAADTVVPPPQTPAAGQTGAQTAAQTPAPVPVAPPTNLMEPAAVIQPEIPAGGQVNAAEIAPGIGEAGIQTAPQGGQEGGVRLRDTEQGREGQAGEVRAEGQEQVTPAPAPAPRPTVTHGEGQYRSTYEAPESIKQRTQAQTEEEGIIPVYYGHHKDSTGERRVGPLTVTTDPTFAQAIAERMGTAPGDVVVETVPMDLRGEKIFDPRDMEDLRALETHLIKSMSPEDARDVVNYLASGGWTGVEAQKDNLKAAGFTVYMGVENNAMNFGRLTEKKAAPVAKETSTTTAPTAEVVVETPPQAPARLPSELAGAKPKYKKSALTFESDIDKALYIAGRRGVLSLHDKKYVAWLKEQGFTDEQIETQGSAIRKRIKEQMANAPEGEAAHIPSIAAVPEMNIPTTMSSSIHDPAAQFMLAEKQNILDNFLAVTGRKPGDVTLYTERLTPKQIIAEGLAKELGARGVIFVEGDVSFEGVHFGGYVFYKAAPQLNLVSSGIHEVVHIIQTEAEFGNPTAIAMLEKAENDIVNGLKAAGIYDKAVEEIKISYAANGQAVSDKTIRRELIARTAGVAATKAEFWAYIRDNNKSLYDRFVAVARRMMAYIQKTFARMTDSEVFKSFGVHRIYDPENLARFHREVAVLISEWHNYVTTARTMGVSPLSYRDSAVEFSFGDIIKIANSTKDKTLATFAELFGKNSNEWFKQDTDSAEKVATIAEEYVRDVDRNPGRFIAGGQKIDAIEVENSYLAMVIKHEFRKTPEYKSLSVLKSALREIEKNRLVSEGTKNKLDADREQIVKLVEKIPLNQETTQELLRWINMPTGQLFSISPNMLQLATIVDNAYLKMLIKENPASDLDRLKMSDLEIAILDALKNGMITQVAQKEAEASQKQRETAINRIVKSASNLPIRPEAKAIIVAMATKWNIGYSRSSEWVFNELLPNNTHPVMTLGDEALMRIGKKLEEGKTGKNAFREAVAEEHAEAMAKIDVTRNGWSVFKQSTDMNDAAEFQKAVCAAPSWCNARSIDYAHQHISAGDIHVYFKEGVAQVGIRMENGEISRSDPPRGNTPDQSLTPLQEEIAERRLLQGDIPGGEKFLSLRSVKKAVYGSIDSGKLHRDLYKYITVDATTEDWRERASVKPGSFDKINRTLSTKEKIPSSILKQLENLPIERAWEENPDGSITVHGEVTANDIGIKGISEVNGKLTIVNRPGDITGKIRRNIDLSGIKKIGELEFLASAYSSIEMPNLTDVSRIVVSGEGAYDTISMPQVKNVRFIKIGSSYDYIKAKYVDLGRLKNSDKVEINIAGSLDYDDYEFVKSVLTDEMLKGFFIPNMGNADYWKTLENIGYSRGIDAKILDQIISKKIAGENIKLVDTYGGRVNLSQLSEVNGTISIAGSEEVSLDMLRNVTELYLSKVKGVNLFSLEASDGEINFSEMGSDVVLPNLKTVKSVLRYDGRVEEFSGSLRDSDVSKEKYFGISAPVLKEVIDLDIGGGASHALFPALEKVEQLSVSSLRKDPNVKRNFYVNGFVSESFDTVEAREKRFNELESMYKAGIAAETEARKAAGVGTSGKIDEYFGKTGYRIKNGKYIKIDILGQHAHPSYLKVKDTESGEELTLHPAHVYFHVPKEGEMDAEEMRKYEDYGITFGENIILAGVLDGELNIDSLKSATDINVHIDNLSAPSLKQVKYSINSSAVKNAHFPKLNQIEKFYLPNVEKFYAPELKITRGSSSIGEHIYAERNGDILNRGLYLDDVGNGYFEMRDTDDMIYRVKKDRDEYETRYYAQWGPRSAKDSDLQSLKFETLHGAREFLYKEFIKFLETARGTKNAYDENFVLPENPFVTLHRGVLRPFNISEEDAPATIEEEDDSDLPPAPLDGFDFNIPQSMRPPHALAFEAEQLKAKEKALIASGKSPNSFIVKNTRVRLREAEKRVREWLMKHQKDFPDFNVGQRPAFPVVPASAQQKIYYDLNTRADNSLLAAESVIKWDDKYSALADDLVNTHRDLLEKIPISINARLSNGGRYFSLRGGYGKIEIAKDSTEARIILHEIIHGLTVAKIDHEYNRLGLNRRDTGKKHIADLRKIAADQLTPEPIKKLINVYFDSIRALGHAQDILGEGKKDAQERELRTNAPYFRSSEIYARRFPRKTDALAAWNDLKEKFVAGGINPLHVKITNNYGAWEVRIDKEAGEIAKNLPAEQTVSFYNKDLNFFLIRTKTKFQPRVRARAGKTDLVSASGVPYGLSNITEFVSEVMTKPSFQKKLNEVSYGKKTLWNRFIGAVRGILGVDINNEGMLARAIEATGEVMDMPDQKGSYNINVPSMNIPQKAPIFYSRLTRSLEKMPTGKNSIGKIMDYASQADIEERKWTGFTDWIEQKRKEGVKSISKDEVMQFLEENEIQVEEVQYGRDTQKSILMVGWLKDNKIPTPQSPMDWTAVGIAIERAANIASQRGDIGHYNRLWTLVDEANRHAEGVDITGTTAGNAQYGGSELQLPGGKKYRELVLQSPMRLPKTLPEGYHIESKKMQWNGVEKDTYYVYSDAGHAMTTGYADEKTAIKEFNRPLGKDFRGSHFQDVSNPIVHVRFNERTDTDGKKVLFLEEVQSDWGQKGREVGFTGEEKKFIDPDLKLYESPLGLSEKEYSDLIDRLRDRYNPADLGNEDSIYRRVLATQKEGGITPAPFVTDTNKWTALALRRMVRWAAENGYDKIAWTTDAMQDDRYNLMLRDITSILRHDNGEIDVFMNNGNMHRLDETQKKEALKLLGNRVNGSEPFNIDLSENPLTIGSFSYYKDFVEPIAKSIVKPWGGKVENISIPGDQNKPQIRWDDRRRSFDVIDSNGEFIVGYSNKYDAEEYLNQNMKDLYGGAYKVPSITITPEMKKSVVEVGQPMMNIPQQDALDPQANTNSLKPEPDLPAKTKEFIKLFSTANIPQRDMSRIESIYALPFWFAKDHPEFKKILQTQIRRQEDKNSLFQFLTQNTTKNGKTHEFLALSKKERDALFPIIVESDEENIMKTEDELKERGMNDAQIKAYFAWEKTFRKAFETWTAMAEASIYAPYNDLNKHPWFRYYENPKDLFKDDKVMREGVVPYSNLQKLVEGKTTIDDILWLTRETDEKILAEYRADIERAQKAVTTPLEGLKRMRAEFDKVKFYMPRFRKQQEILTRVWEGEPYKSRILEDARDGYTTRKRSVTAQASRMRLEKKYPGKKITTTMDTLIPESMFENLESMAIERFIQDALDKTSLENPDITEDTISKLQDSLFQTISNELNARGFGQHAIHRQGYMWVVRAKDAAGRTIAEETVKFGNVAPKVDENGNEVPMTEKEWSDAYELAVTNAKNDISLKHPEAAKIISMPAVIKGYEEKDGTEVFTKYFSGLSGFLSKKKSAFDFFNALKDVGNKYITKTRPGGKEQKIRTFTEPRVFEYSRQYIKDMLRNQTALDMFGGRARFAAYLYNISGKLSAAAVNLTQNFVSAIPVLSRYVGEYRKLGYKGPGAHVLYMKAMKDAAAYINARWRGTTTSAITQDEGYFLRDEHEKGSDTAQYLQEIMGATDSQIKHGLSEFMRIVSWPFSMAEQLNRTSAMLAMFRLQNNTPTSDKYQVNPKTMHERATEFSNEVHYLMGKSNLPAWARSGTEIGQAARVAYTFRGFNHNFLLMLKNFTELKDKDGNKTGQIKMDVVGMSLAYLALFGGAASVPFLDDFLDMLERMMHVPYRAIIRKKAREIGPWLDHLGTAGLPALIFGADISGSLSMGIPLVGETAGESVYGVYGGMADRWKKAYDALGAHDFDRAAELASPMFVGNVLRGVREYREGVTSPTGKVLFDYGKTNEKIVSTPYETAQRLMGFRNVREAEASRESWSITNAKRSMDEEKMKIYRQIKLADPKKRAAVIADLVPKFNRSIFKMNGAVKPIKAANIKRVLTQKPEMWMLEYEAGAE